MVGVALLSVGASVACNAASPLDRAELRSYDLRLGLRGERDTPPGVVIVAIDDRTLDQLNLREIPRSLHTNLIHRLAAAYPALIAYDVFFAERTFPRQDRELVAAFHTAERHSQLLLGAAKLRTPGRAPSLFISPRGLRSTGVDVGSLIISEDADGTFRKIDYTHEGIPAFGIRAAELARGNVELATPHHNEPAWVDLRGGPGTFPTLSFSDVLQGRVPSAALRGKNVLVGATDVTLSDRHPVPPDDELMAGVEFHANVMQTAREGYPLRNATGATDAALLIVLGVLAPLLALRLSIRTVTLFWAATVGAFLIALQLAFDNGVVLAAVVPMLAAGLSLTGTIAVEEVTVRRDRRRIRYAFARHVDPQVADQILADAGSGGQLPGRELEATVLFCDLRDWTGYVERATPARIVETLDRYLESVTEIVTASGGTIVSFQGDGVMSVFGAPLAQPDHATRALTAARALVDEIPTPIGVGIASGDVISGTIGNGRRLEYTVTGNPTNLAARLQGLTKDLGCKILLDDQAKQSLDPAAARTLHEAGSFEIRGRSEPQRAWATEPG